MNLSIVRYILGQVIRLEGILLLLLHPGLWKDSYHAVRRRFRRKN